MSSKHFLFESKAVSLVTLAQLDPSSHNYWRQTTASASILKDSELALIPNPFQEYIGIDLISVNDCLFGEEMWWHYWSQSVCTHFNSNCKWDKKTKRFRLHTWPEIRDQFITVYNCSSIPDTVLTHILVNLNPETQEHIKQELGVYADV